MSAEELVGNIDRFSKPDAEAEDLFRLYRPEWIIAYTAHVALDGYQTEELGVVCRNYFVKNYQDRVHAEDMRITADDKVRPEWVRLELRLPVLKGEFVHRADAEAHAQGWEPPFAIVERNSRADHDLRSYGIKKREN